MLVLATAFSGTVLLAQSDDTPASPPPAGRGQPPSHVIERFDLDGDGQLNQQERAAAHAAREERRQNGDRPGPGGRRRGNLLERFDADGDGQLNEAERAALRADAPNHPRLMARVDTDKDGTLSDAEWEAARERLFARRGGGAGKGGPGKDGERPRWRQKEQP